MTIIFLYSNKTCGRSGYLTALGSGHPIKANHDNKAWSQLAAVSTGCWTLDTGPVITITNQAHNTQRLSQYEVICVRIIFPRWSNWLPFSVHHHET